MNLVHRFNKIWSYRKNNNISFIFLYIIIKLYIGRFILDNKDNYIEEDEIDLKEVFSTLLKYKYSIILITMLITLLAAIYAYYKPNIYKATSTLEVSSKKSPISADDILGEALSQGSKDIDTEIQIIKSRFVTNMALKKVDFVKHYYGIKYYKKIELYKNSPFNVDIKHGYDVEFKITPTSNNKFILEVKDAKDENGTKWSYYREVSFGDWIKNKHFEILVKKIGDFNYKEYRFIAKDPDYLADDVRKGLQVSQAGKKAAIINISYEDNIASRAQHYVNAVAKAYLKQSIERKTKEATKKLEFIDKQLSEITKSLQSSAKNLEDFKKKTDTVSLSSKAEVEIKRSAELETQLSDISLRREIIQALFNQVRNGKGLESISIVGMGSDGSSLLGMIKQLQDTMITRKALLQDYTPAYPDVIKATNTIKQLKKSIYITIKNMLQLLKDKEALLKKSIAKEKKIISTLPANERVLTNLKREFLVNEKIYSYLLEKRSEVAIAKASTISKNRVVDSALLPQKPIKPKRKLIIVVGVILGLILGIMLAFLRSFLNDKIESKEDIEKATTVPIVASIPHISKDANDLVVLKSPKSIVAESFRSFRTNLQFMAKKKSGYTVALTSTISGEGKTTVAVNLAAIISLTGKRVIILNIDMRKPTLHEKFNLENSKGMSTLLTNKNTLTEVIEHSEYDNLDIILSGPVPPNPSELLESEDFADIIKSLKSMYDIIILDTPPIGLVSDARFILDLCDISLYVLRDGYSKKEFINNINILKSEGIKGLGIVFNDIKASRKGYGYGYGNGYGYYK